MKNYPGKVIHIIGGVREYIGEMGPLPHPNGPNWYRINNACQVIHTTRKNTNESVRLIQAIDGPQRDYEKYADLRIPEDSIIEITILNPKGNLHNLYKKEINAVKMDRIVAPGAADLEAIKKGKQALN